MTTGPSTWNDVHAGDIVLGHDCNHWGVTSRGVAPGGVEIEIVRHGERLASIVPHGTPITVVSCDESHAPPPAVALLMAAFPGTEIIRESYQP